MGLRQCQKEEIEDLWRQLQKAESVERQIIVLEDARRSGLQTTAFEIMKDAVTQNAADELSRHTNSIQQ